MLLKKISRITALLTRLQSQRSIKGDALAEHFGVSIRTIYRDIKTLQEAGIPIIGQPGTGFSLLEGYRLPALMFTEAESAALLTAQKIIAQNPDASLRESFDSAMVKIKAALRSRQRDKLELLADNTAPSTRSVPPASSTYLSAMQEAILQKHPLLITYFSISQQEETRRKLQPVGLYFTREHWVLVAWCLLREDYREFRLDHIRTLSLVHEEQYTPTLSLNAYFEQQKLRHSNHS